MKQSTTMTISIALTVFVIAAMGAVLWTVRAVAQINSVLQANAAAQSGAAQASISAPAAVNAPPAISPEVQKEINDREAAYQSLVSQANARIEQLQQEQLTLAAQLNSQQGAASTATPTGSITPQDAGQIASKYLNRADVYSIDTLSSNGAVSYRVTFSSGDIVVVSSAGQITSVQQAPTIASAPSSSRGGGGYSEHEGGGGHGDN